MSLAALHFSIEGSDGQISSRWRFRGNPGPRIDLGPDVLRFSLNNGEKRYLLAEGLADQPSSHPTKLLFPVAADSVIRLDAIRGADGLPKGCRLMVLLFDGDGREIHRASEPFHAGRPFIRTPAVGRAARASLILQVVGSGALGELTFGLETTPVGSIGRARRALRDNDPSTAADALRVAGRFQPRDPALPRLTARLAWLKRDFEAAASAYLDLEARSGLGRGEARRLVSSLRRAGRLDEAEQAFARCYPAHTTNLPALMEWARLAENRGDIGLAAERWETVLGRTQAPLAAERLSEIYDRQGLWAKAEHILTDHLRTDPQNIELNKRLVLRLRAQERHAEAAPYLQTLTRLVDASERARWRALATDSARAAFETGSADPRLSQGLAALPASTTAGRAVDRWLVYGGKGLEAYARAELAVMEADDERPRAQQAATRALAQLDYALGPSLWPDVLRRLQALDLTDHLAELRAWRLRLLTDMGDLAEAAHAADRIRPDTGVEILALANHAAAIGAGADDRLALINRLFSAYDLAPLTRPAGAPLHLDQVRAQAAPIDSGPLISVIVPVWNGVSTLDTALRSLEIQSWRRLEVLMVDDASTDDSLAMMKGFAARDPRFRVLANPVNGGPYVARNRGLAEARGEFVTCHDADDWAHPQRLERQVQALIGTPDAIGNMSRCVTVTPDMIFASRAANSGGFRWNFSSLLFRRARALETAGFWDEARFGADGEYVGRLRRHFGTMSVEKLDAGVLAPVRQSVTSLTGRSDFGLAARGHSTRSTYRTHFEKWHRDDPAPRVAASGASPTFPRPAVVRGLKAPDRFDVVIASDFRLSGGTTASNVQEIIAQTGGGLLTGLIQMESPMLRPQTLLSDKVLDLVDYDRVHLLTSEQVVRADVLVARWPPAVANVNTAIARVDAGAIAVIANQTPWRGEIDGELIYDPASVDRAVATMFGRRPVWHPIGPTVRSALSPHDHDVLVAPHDWINVLDLSLWKGTPRRPRQSATPPVIGRHARDFPGKWPLSAPDLLAVYPDDGSLGVRILGGAAIAEEVVGQRLSRWDVLAFDEIGVQDYLQSLDVFVYFPDPSLEEAFGRAILEAMAVGVPAILPHRFEPVFGRAALYCETQNVTGLVKSLMHNAKHYEAQSRVGLSFAQQFGLDRHLERLAAIRQPAGRV